MKILYAGDSPAGGPANYLLGVLKFLKADFVHLPPSKILRPSLLRRRFDAFILSDFPARRAPRASQKMIARQVREGAGLLMVGGWSSFSGPFGGWRGSEIEKLLPVSCLGRDDRMNFPSGALMISKKRHPMFRSLSFKNPPVICGLNEIRPKKNANVILTAREVMPPTFFLPPHRGGRKGGGSLRLGQEYPLLIIDSNPHKRIAALATDLAPHWCGGLVDWGGERLKLAVKAGISIEVGDLYVRFVSSLLRWLIQRDPP